MAGLEEVGGLGGGTGQGAARQGAVVGGDTSGGALCGVDGDGVRGAVSVVGVGLVLHAGAQQGQVELVRALVGHGCAHVPGGVAHQEGKVRGAGVLGGADEVTLVLARLVVHHNDELVLLEVLNSLFNWHKLGHNVLLCGCGCGDCIVLYFIVLVVLI